MEQIVTSDGVAIAVHRFEPVARAERLPPVVLQHGFAADTRANWVAPGVVEALTASGRSVISVDARGHGQSDKPHEASFYGEARMSRDLTEVFDALGLESLDLVGYSMGAVIAVITASTERRVRRMVIGGVGAGIVKVGGVDRRTVDTRVLADALRASDASTVTSAVAKAFRTFAEITGADRLVLAAQAEAIHRAPISLRAITAPTRLIIGDADPLAREPEVLVAAIPGAELVVVPGDHLRAVAAREFAPAIVEFLAVL